MIARARRDYFAALLSLDEVDRVLTTLDRRYPDVTLKRADQSIAASQYTTDGTTLDVARVYELFDGGATITLAFLDRVLPELEQLCRGLELELGCPLQANVYLTPAGTQGARAHYDTHDVLVLQIVGGKCWTLYDAPIELPLSGQAFDPERHQPGAMSQQFELHAGEVAYVPRGCMHSARAVDSISLHVTLGLLRYTWTDLLLELAGRVALEEPAFRRSLPPRWAHADFDRAEARRAIRELLVRLDAAPALEASLDAMHERFIAECPPPLRGQLEQLSMLRALNDASLVGARPGVLTRVRSDEHGVQIDCYGRRIHLPPSTRAAVEYALARSAFRIGELPGVLDAAGRQALVRRLVREGLLRQLAGDILQSGQAQP